MKLDLLTNATVVDDAIRFVSQKSKEEIRSSTDSNEEKRESNEHDYDEDEDRPQEEQKEEETAEIRVTTNTVF